MKKYCTKLREKQALGYKTSSLKPGLGTVLDKQEAIDFFKAASEFYKAAPWKTFPVGDALILTWPEAGSRIFFFYPFEKEAKVGE